VLFFQRCFLAVGYLAMLFLIHPLRSVFCEFEWIWKAVIAVHLRYRPNPRTCLDGQRKTTKKLHQNRSPYRELNPGSLEYEAKILSAAGPHLVAAFQRRAEKPHSVYEAGGNCYIQVLILHVVTRVPGERRAGLYVKPVRYRGLPCSRLESLPLNIFEKV
jgi:hypothetical protein